MGTITLNLQDEVENQFRTVASLEYGKKKGYLGKAMNQALECWMKKRTKRMDSEALALLEKGFEMGSVKFDRDEVHER
ncbi:MAG: hypothetical protein MSIBF_04085 [Candidatus Altiarchaeales archaeon IMC4]|nr:MAG: hypothetical protein MSIBF_04085 [Candidatus Altiarchaeales archaeon IMC4]